MRLEGGRSLRGPGRIAFALAAAALIVATLLLPAGCGGGGPGAEAQKFINRLNEKKFGEAYDMLAAGSPARSISREEFIRRAETASGEEIEFVNFGVLEEEIEGGRATVKWAAITRIPDQDDTPTEQELTLVREGGRWKIWQ